MDEAGLKHWLKLRLSERRYKHSAEVADRAGILAKLHGGDAAKARLAGLLHDCCRDMDGEEQLKIIKSYGILLDTFTVGQPQLYHAISGTVFAQQELGLNDADVLSAIRYHTTGRAFMTRLEQIVYLADWTSLDRKYPGVVENRVIAEGPPEKAMLKSLSDTIVFLAKRKKPIVRDTWEAYHYFYELTERDNA